MKINQYTQKNYEGSYTVEAAFIMSLVLFAMVTLIKTAYGQCRETTGNMRLQEMVEVLRHRESEAGDSLSINTVPYQIQAQRESLDNMK